MTVELPSSDLPGLSPSRLLSAYAYDYPLTCPCPTPPIATPSPKRQPELRQSGDGRGLANGMRKEVNGGHIPEVDIGVEHLFDRVFHLAADEGEAAGRNVDELDWEHRGGSEFPAVKFGNADVWEGGKGEAGERECRGLVLVGR